MARIGGRSTWFSWFVGIVCAGVVVALAFLAAPMVPAVVDWSGQALRGDLGQREVAPAEQSSADPAGDSAPALPASCADLYPEDLWSLLTTASGVELLEAADFPPTGAAGLPEALGARVTLSCTWRGGSDESVSATIAEVADDAADTAARVLAGAGFACSPFGLGVRCQGSPGGGDAAVETHTVRDGIWLVTIEDGWQPPDYADGVRTHLWRS